MSKREIQYLGNSAFQVVTAQGTRLLIDPYITGNPFCPMKLEQIPDPDLVLVSHGAADHFGDTLALAQRSQCIVLCDPAVATFLTRNGIPRERLKLGVWGFIVHFRDVTVRVVESKHLSRTSIGNETFIGIPLGFVIHTGDDPGIYHPGDTSIFSDVKVYAQLYKPAIGLLPVGGATIGGEGTFSAELWPPEAALVAKWMKLKVAIPMHYSSPEHPKEFEQRVKALSPKTRVLPMKPGEKVNL